MGYIRAAGEFIILIHLFSCAWLFVGAVANQWMDEEEKLYKERSILYLDAVYFVATTMTSVGYGDKSAFGKGVLSMEFVMVTQFFGLLGFSIIKDQIFSATWLTT